MMRTHKFNYKSYRILPGCSLLFLLLGLSTTSSAQLIKARFNKNYDPSVPINVAFLEDNRMVRLDTAFKDLQVTIKLSEKELKDPAVQGYLQEMAGALSEFAKRLKKDRVVTSLEFSKTAFTWIYIYDLPK